MDRAIEIWEKLPEWARWILCWPLIVLFTVLSGILIQIIFSSSAWMYGFEGMSPDFFAPRSFSEFWIHGVIIVFQSSVFFFSICYLVPRIQDIVAAIFAIFSTLMNSLGIIGVIITFTDGETTILQCISGTLLMCVGVATALYWAYKIRISIKDGKELADVL
jgi:hypothetical protein